MLSAVLQSPNHRNVCYRGSFPPLTELGYADAARTEEEDLVDLPSAIAPSFQANEDASGADIAQNAEKFLDAVVKVHILNKY